MPGHRVYERAVPFDLVFGSLSILSLILLLWQWVAALRFPLHRRTATTSFAPDVTLLKPLKGCDPSTEVCLRSWFAQDYGGAVQMLFAVGSSDDPVCDVVQKLKAEFPDRDVELIVAENPVGPNAKVSKLVELEKRAQYELLVVSDADVRVPADFLTNAVSPLANPEIGLINCFYRFANPVTLAMQWEAISINCDFWSQVLQAKTLKPPDFALGAVMVTRRKCLAEIGGFRVLADCLADDYQLGNRIARNGHRIELCPVVVECWDSPMGWSAVWKHQLRWARTIRVCQPVPYFFSMLSNPTLWPLIWTAVSPSAISLLTLVVAVTVRSAIAAGLQHRLTRTWAHLPFVWLAPIKDLLQTAIWFCAFAGNTIEWRGQKYALRPDGTLVKRSAGLRPGMN
jgi:ceramide glucosyltransferase